MLTSRFIVVFAVFACTSAVLAQTTLDWPVGETMPYSRDSGVRPNPSRTSQTVFEETVQVNGAGWLRLYFSQAELEPGSFLRLTSLWDKQVQELDINELAMWGFSSAYFNGDAVKLELVAAPGTMQNRIVLREVAYEIGSAIPREDPCGICNGDDRVPSFEDFAGRLLPAGCSATVWTEGSSLVTAGHCVAGNDIIQFRVPPSNPNCSINHPPVEDQFPVTETIYANGGPGNDWAVMTTGTNNLGETAYERYGDLRPISTGIGSIGDYLCVWGYGLDIYECERSQVQQTSCGTINGVSHDRYTYDVDTTYGNSGSSAFRDDEIIAIVTHCGCPTNIGTRMDLPLFKAAREDLGLGGYCYGVGDECEGRISSVTVGNINATTSGCPMYVDQTHLTTTMILEEDYPITVEADHTLGNERCTVWVDWDGDIELEGGNEKYVLSGGPTTFTGTITPPANAAFGPTRMRIRLHYNSNGQSCGTYDGEVEDYTIIVADPNAPNNDYCDDAVWIGDGSHAVSNISSTTDGPTETGTCSHLQNDVWYRILASCTGTVTVDICDANFDVAVAVYKGTCPNEPGHAIACDDAGCPSGVGAKVTFDSTINHIYFIRVGGYDGAQGTANMIISCDEPSSCPADLTGDDQVNIDDIFAVLGLWGDCDDPCPPYCAGDMTEDCTVNIDDIFSILGQWGPCE